jgi:hypothetical protein
MAELLERMEQRRDEEGLGRKWLKALDALTREIGGVAPRRPLTCPVTSCESLQQALQERGIDPQEVAARQLAGVVGELAPRLAAVLFDECLCPSGLWEWWPGPRPSREIIGRGWLVDLGALQILTAAAPGPAELWIVQDALEFLTVGAQRSQARQHRRGVVGLVDAQWSQTMANRVPDGTEVFVCPGPAAPQVFNTFRGRCLSCRPRRSDRD